MYGKNTREKLPEDQRLVSILEELKERGYVTGHINDACQTTSMAYD